MKVRAKFRCDAITRSRTTSYVDGQVTPAEVQTIKLFPVCDGSEENKKFFASTPVGSIELGTVNADAAKQFDIGKEYYVDFTPAGSRDPQPATSNSQPSANR